MGDYSWSPKLLTGAAHCFLEPQNHLRALTVAAETRYSTRLIQHPCLQTGWPGWFHKRGGDDAFWGYTLSSEVKHPADKFFSLPPHHGQLGDAVGS